MIFERLPRRQTAILLSCCIAVLALVGKRLAAQGTARAPAAQAVALTESSGAARPVPPPRLVVYVVGAVRHAGLVRLPREPASPMRSSARVARAAKADLTLVNLAAPVADGQQIVVPTRARSRRGRRAAPGPRRRRREGEPRQRDARAARRAPRHRPGDGAEDPRLAPDAWPAALGRRPRRDPRHRARPRRAAARPGDAVSRLQERARPRLAGDRARRPRARARRGELGRASLGSPASPRAAAAVGALAPPADRRSGSSLAAFALAALGLWWGGLRLHELDRSYPRVADRRSRRRAGRRHGRCEPLAFAVAGDGGGAPLRRRRAARAGAARAPRRPRASAGRRARAPGAPGRPARARDRLRRARMARAAWDPCRPARERPLARRRPAGRDRWRRRPAAHGRSSTRSALGTTGERRSLVIGVVLGADEGIDPELRDAFKASGLYHLLAVSGQNIVLIGFGVLGLAYVARARARRRSHARDRGDPCLRARGGLAAVRRPRGRRGLPRVAGVAALAPERPLAHDGDGGGGAARVDAALAARAGIPALVRRGGRDLPRAAAPAPVAARAIRCLPRSSRWSASRPPAGSSTAPILWLQFGTIPLWTVAGERARRAGDADPARLRTRGRRARAGDPSRGGGALVDRRSSQQRGSRSRRA